MLFIYFISILTILSSLLVISFEVTTPSAWSIFIVSVITTFILKKIVIPDIDPESKHKHQKQKGFKSFLFSFDFLDSNFRWNDILKYALYFILYTLLVVGIVFFYSRFQTTSSNPLVWTILPTWFLPVLLLIVFTIVTLSLAKNYLQKRVAIILFPIIFLLLPVAFPIGTDYDPFVHRAAEQTIVSEGRIQPRTILYSGEYGLVSVISKLTHLPVKQVNIFLLPILVILVIPWLLNKTFGNKSLVLFFLLPFSILTATVPQSLGIFFLLLLLLLWRNDNNNYTITRLPNYQLPLTLYPLLAIASFACHPFAGIAAFVFLGWNIVHVIVHDSLAKIQSDEYVALGRFIVRAMLMLLAIIFLIGSSLAIPAALILNNNLDSQFAITSIHFNTEALSTLKSIVTPSWIRYSDPLSFVHFFGKNYYLLFFIVIVFGIIQKIKSTITTSNTIKHTGTESTQSFSPFTFYPSPFILSFLSIFVSSLIVLFYLQPNVTAGEHTQLFTRLFSISLVFLWPIFLSHMSHIPAPVPQDTGRYGASTYHISKINYQIAQLPVTLYSLLFTILIVSNIYLQFPHSDRFVNFKGYLTSQDDLSTVHAIEVEANKPYLVLANQSVGAAALDQFGFSHYVTVRTNATKNTNQHDDDTPTTLNAKPSTLNPQFFYSIPISSQAHGYYLRMTKEPSQELIDEIFQAYEINELYLVLNEYWKISPKSKATLAQLASIEEIDSDTIFKFENKKRQ